MKDQKKADKLISIIIPVYNGEKYLHRCLDSVINQSYQELDIIIVNDGSTDASLEICKAYQKRDGRIQIIKTENAGVSSARNRGMELVKTEWILFMDADDELPFNAIEIYHKTIQDKPDADFIVGGIDKISARRVIHSSFIPISICEEVGKNYAVNILYNLSYGTVWGKLFRFGVIKKQGLQFDQKLTHGEDCVFVYEYLQFSKHPQSIQDTIYRYYVNDLSVTKKFNRGILDSYFNALETLKKCINEKDQVELQAFYHSCILHLLLITVNYSFHKNNPNSFLKKMHEYKKLTYKSIFHIALTEAEMRHMGLGNRCVLYMIKIGFYPGVYLCAKLRQAWR